MTRRTRLFLAGAAGVLLVGLGTGLVVSYMSAQGLTLLGSNGPAELAWVPADTTALAYADVRDIMDSELRRKLADLRPDSGQGTDQLREQTGIDLETDIDYVVTAMSAPASGTDGEAPRPLVLARGRFDQVRLEGLIQEHGGVVEDHAGTRIFVQGENGLAVAFVEPDLAAIGTASAVRRAIDTKASGEDVRGNADLMAIVRDVDDGDAWGVARFDSLPAGSLPTEVAAQLPAISWFSARGFIGAGLEGQVRVEARDEAGATNLREVVQGLLALVRMQAGQQAALADLTNSLQLGGEGTTVSLSFSVPAEVFDALIALRPTVQARGPEVGWSSSTAH